MAYIIGIRMPVHQEPCLQAALVQPSCSLVNIPSMSECSGVMGCSESASSPTAGMVAFSYNAFILKLAKPHPHTPTIVQKENKTDDQQECKDV